ncbi:MAG: tRNA pseudouridine(38-40) synthase TruA [Alphaproteobacteria bacterium]|nr:tRNA pseudouridine(38-40) synthase TruA [Alphaproteobacteria bacterium]|tara:strand:+ start:768 stop:1508 length:741 start_codon:yes stop_codon:yes gene_type:complete
MTRYKLIIEYDGTLFVGWQRQQNGKSVQGELEAALFDLTKVKVQVHGAGRTDSGVHAEGQVAHCDIAREISTDTLRDALNHFLRKVPISVLSVEEVNGTFHARFCALKRHYLYRILNRRPPPTLDKNRIWWTPSRLDEKAMHMAAQTLVGTHDFSSFRATSCQAKSPIKTLDHLDVERIGDEIRVTTSAKSFLQHQVRNLVGTLTMVGYGKWNLDDVRVVLNAQDRSLAGPTAPASGLYLVQVDYP